MLPWAAAAAAAALFLARVDFPEFILEVSAFLSASLKPLNQSSYFCLLVAHGKLQNLTITPSGRKVSPVERERKKERE